MNVALSSTRNYVQNLSKTGFLCNDLNKKRKREFLLLDPTFDEEQPGQYVYIALSLTVNLCATYEENRLDGSGSKSITMFDHHCYWSCGSLTFLN